MPPERSETRVLATLCSFVLPGSGQFWLGAWAPGVRFLAGAAALAGFALPRDALWLWPVLGGWAAWDTWRRGRHPR